MRYQKTKRIFYIVQRWHPTRHEPDGHGDENHFEGYLFIHMGMYMYVSGFYDVRVP